MDVEAEEAEVGAGEPAAEDQADGRTGARHGGVDGERPVAGGPGRERRGDQRQGGGRRERGTEALETAGGQQQQLALGEATEQRRHGEDHEADHEDAAPAVEVGEPAAEEQQATEHQRVAGDDPGQVGAGDVEVLADERQGDVRDGRVEDDHQLRDRDEHEGQAEPLVALRLGGDVVAGRAVVDREFVGHVGFLSSLAGSGDATWGASAAGRMIWSTTWRIVSWSGGRPIRKRRCRQMPASAGASRSRSTPSRSSPRAWARSKTRAAGGRLGTDDALAEGRGELGVAADRGEHAGEGGDGAVVGEAADAAEGLEQVAAQGAGVRDHWLALLGDQGVDDESHLAVPAAVERRLRGPGRGWPRRPW